jgi:hypothetical protein
LFVPNEAELVVENLIAAKLCIFDEPTSQRHDRRPSGLIEDQEFDLIEVIVGLAVASNERIAGERWNDYLIGVVDKDFVISKPTDEIRERCIVLLHSFPLTF